MIEWVITNKEWFFSGIGVAILTSIAAVIRYLVGRKESESPAPKTRQNQKSGMFSRNNQIGSININSNNGDRK